MKLYLKFDFNSIAMLHLQSLLVGTNAEFNTENFNEIEFQNEPSEQEYTALKQKLSANGIEIIENQKVIVVQKIKSTILKMIHNPEDINVKTSVHLSEKIGQSYSFISNLFSEVTYTSIENYIIIQKIEIVKHLIITTELTLTEIAYKYNYSSVAHLSNQFKKCTGLTPSAFQRIIKKRAALTK